MALWEMSEFGRAYLLRETAPKPGRALSGLLEPVRASVAAQFGCVGFGSNQWYVAALRGQPGFAQVRIRLPLRPSSSRAAVWQCSGDEPARRRIELGSRAHPAGTKSRARGTNERNG